MAGAHGLVGRVGRLGLAALLAWLLAGTTRATPAPPEGPRAEARVNWGETLLLALKVNGVPQDGMLRAVRLSDGLAIPQSAWDELNLRILPAACASSTASSMCCWLR